LNAATARNTAANDADAAVGKAAALLAAKTAADLAVQAVKDQVSKEETWRSWRYCELGGVVSGVSLPDPAKGWW
jgi:hypothetical protein